MMHKIKYNVEEQFYANIAQTKNEINPMDIARHAARNIPLKEKKTKDLSNKPLRIYNDSLLFLMLK